MPAQTLFNNAGTAAAGYYQSPTHLNNASRQFDLDVALWYGAIAHPASPDEGAFLTRLFGVLYYGGILFKDNQDNWHDWNAAYGARNPTVPVAAALSHGGRLLIQLPPSNAAANWNAKPATGVLASPSKQEAFVRWKYFAKNKTDRGDFSFWTWLNGNPPVAQNRVISTHGLALADQPTVTANGNKLYLKETKGSTAGTSHSKRHQHYALNPSLGGLGLNSPLSGNPVQGDGLDGHLYLLFFPPNEFRCGGLLVGCENAQFGMGSNRHTGAGHGAGGAANETSATGGFKWADLGRTNMIPPLPVGKKGDMLVDLTGSLAGVQNAAAAFNPDHLDQCPQASGAGGVFNTLPTDEEWAAATPVGGRLTRRSDHLCRIDTHLKAINADHPTIPHLDRLIRLCGEWIAKQRVTGFGAAEDGIAQAVSDLHNAATNLRAAI
jgi:Novel toxin 11